MQFFVLTTPDDAVEGQEDLYITALGEYGSVNKALDVYRAWSTPENTRRVGILTEDSLDEIANVLDSLKKEIGWIDLYILPHFRPELVRVLYAVCQSDTRPNSDNFKTVFTVEDPDRFIFRMELSETKFVNMARKQPLSELPQSGVRIRRPW